MSGSGGGLLASRYLEVSVFFSLNNVNSMLASACPKLQNIMFDRPVAKTPVMIPGTYLGQDLNCGLEFCAQVLDEVEEGLVLSLYGSAVTSV